jgi:hypothetical protein
MSIQQLKIIEVLDFMPSKSSWQSERSRTVFRGGGMFNEAVDTEVEACLMKPWIRLQQNIKQNWRVSTFTAKLTDRFKFRC